MRICDPAHAKVDRLPAIHFLEGPGASGEQLVAFLVQKTDKISDESVQFRKRHEKPLTVIKREEIGKNGHEFFQKIDGMLFVHGTDRDVCDSCQRIR